MVFSNSIGALAKHFEPLSSNDNKYGCHVEGYYKNHDILLVLNKNIYINQLDKRLSRRFDFRSLLCLRQAGHAVSRKNVSPKLCCGTEPICNRGAFLKLFSVDP